MLSLQGINKPIVELYVTVNKQSQKLVFKKYSKGEMEATIKFENKKIVFLIEKFVAIDWKEINQRIQYYIDYYNEIIELSKKSIKNHIRYKLIWWNVNFEFDFEIVELPTNSQEQKVDYILLPICIDDPYVKWSVSLFIENNVPKLREVKRD